MYLSRHLELLLNQYLSIFSAVAITGPRQSGKSTLLQHVLPTYQYVTFDDDAMRQLFHEDPVGFFKRYPDKTIFDEVQKVPEIFERLKIEIDQDRQSKGKFVLSGSSQFSMLKGITESLAGRIGLLELLPLQYQEMPIALREESIYQGSYPEPVTANFRHNPAWYNAYLQTYLEKDVRDLLNIRDLLDFRRFIQLLASRTSTTLSLSSLANELGISVHTTKAWLSVLEASYIIFLVPPYYNNLGKRIIKSPKLYFWDTGLVAHLTHIHSKALYENGPMAGALFENYLVSEIAKQEKNTAPPTGLYYYRSNHGVEVDLIVDRGTAQDWIEIKKSQGYRPKMSQALSTLTTLLPPSVTVHPYLLYQGETLPDGSPNDVRVWNYGAYLKRGSPT